jgi:multimeric flavodoxin WrbA
MNTTDSPMHVLGVSTSPRLEGNSDTLLRAVLQGAQDAGADVQHLWLGNARLGFCTECNFCHTTGSCKIADDFQPTMQRILTADRLVLATPVFFAGFCAQAKLLIDRCQAYWARHHLLGSLPPREPARHVASLLAVGRDEEPGSFACLQQTKRILCSSLGFGRAPDMYVGAVVHRGDIQAHASAQSRAWKLGHNLVTGDPSALMDTVDICL